MDRTTTEEVREPCPFCGASLDLCETGECAGIWFHPGVVTDDDCVLSGRGFYEKQLLAWNTRLSQPTEPTDDVERVRRIMANMPNPYDDDSLTNYRARYDAWRDALATLTPPVTRTAGEADALAGELKTAIEDILLKWCD